MTSMLLALLLSVALAAPPTWRELKGYTFERYVKDFSKKYVAGTTEYFYRRTIFENTLREIQLHNAQPSVSWRMGVNHLSDWTKDEFKRLNGARRNPMGFASRHKKTYAKKNVAVPYEVDYRNRVPPVLTTVKDQGDCGSCWAHGATEQMETFWALSTSKLMVLSQQQVTACTPNPNECGGFGGCQGATAELAFDYVATAGGLTTEWFYPYTAHNGTTGVCLKGGPGVVRLTGYTAVPTNDQSAVMEVLATEGPLAVNVDASSWQNYESGIFTGCKYNISIDHVVQLVGYGTDNALKMDYWIIRNSWTPYFGENGYIRLHRSATPTCGWDVDPQDGTGCKGGPPQLWACGMCGVLFDTTYPNVQA